MIRGSCHSARSTRETKWALRQASNSLWAVPDYLDAAELHGLRDQEDDTCHLNDTGND